MPLCLMVAVVAVGIAAGCGSSEEGTPRATSDTGMHAASAHAQAHARDYVIDHIRTRLGGLDRLAPLYRSAGELLPNVRFAEGEARPTSLTDAVVVGTVASVTPDLGFADPATGIEGERIGDGIKVPFDSPDALWRTIRLTVDLEDVVSGDIPDDTRQIKVGLAIGNINTDEQHIRDGLKALGRVVWFLRKDSPVFAYDPSLYADAEDGRLIAQLTSDGHLTFPMIEEGDPAARALAGTTLAELRKAAVGPVRALHVELNDNGTWAR